MEEGSGGGTDNVQAEGAEHTWHRAGPCLERACRTQIAFQKMCVPGTARNSLTLKAWHAHSKAFAFQARLDLLGGQMLGTIGRHRWHALERRLLSVTRNGCPIVKRSIAIKLDAVSEIG